MSTTTATPTADWTGASGQKYRYYVYQIGTTFKAVPGNYIFSKVTADNKWCAIYIGETGDLSARFDGHHKMPCIKRNGATHIMVHANNNGERARRAEEADLLANYASACNG